MKSKIWIIIIVLIIAGISYAIIQTASQNKSVMDIDEKLNEHTYDIENFLADGEKANDKDARELVGLQNRLQKTINLLPEVHSSSVQIHQMDEAEPSAEVYIMLNENASLTDEQKKAIKAILSDSIANMSRDNVKIVVE